MMRKGVPEDIRFGREICCDLAQAERREWYLANGVGGYAAGNIAGTLTRRYHGLLTAPLKKPLGRFLVFAKADASVTDGQSAWPLFSNRWSGGALQPAGHLNIESFRLEGRLPVWTFAFGGIRVESRVWTEYGANTVCVAYRLLSGPSEGLRLDADILINARDYHGNARSGDLDPLIKAEGDRLRVGFKDDVILYFMAPGGSFEEKRVWVENFDLPDERERGLPDNDNHLCVGKAHLSLKAGEWTGIILSLDEDSPVDLESSMLRFLSRDIDLLKQAKASSPELKRAPWWIESLILASDSFLFSRPLKGLADGESVIAGYPWFGDWGRDTMIALPGLTLVTGRHGSALKILETFARFVDKGMLPNRFPGDGEAAEYNSVDAALWYILAWRAYIEATDDRESLKGIFSVLMDIIEWYRKGTRYGTGMDEKDGLLRSGEPGVQLTWMDVKIGDRVVTPRTGKAVEVNALWFNALNTVAEFSEMTGASPDPYRKLAEQARRGFQRYINSGNGGLYDVIDGPDGNDAGVRPNQIFAVSLPFSPLDRGAQAGVVRLCGKELLTSYGLRSLSPSHPDYRPYYSGGVIERDGAYHQGTVWAWLLGYYAMAEFRVTGDPVQSQAHLEPIRDHLSDAGIGTVSEIFDGSPPHNPRGCPAQAWSVACTLEAWWKLERAKGLNQNS